MADVTLRFIVNLQPSNDLQNVIVGDMCGMPLFTQWTLCELMGHECYHYSGEDEVAAFYLYRLSAAPGWPGSCWAELQPRRHWRPCSYQQTRPGRRCA